MIKNRVQLHYCEFFSLQLNVIYEWLINGKKKKERLREEVLNCTVYGFCFLKEYFQVGVHSNSLIIN